MPIILAIDRSNGVLERHRENLEKSGYVLERVASTKSALRQLARHTFDLLIFDKTLASNGGEDRAFQERVAALPRLVIASDGKFQGTARWLRGGHARYVFGTCEFRELLHALREVEGLYRLETDRKRLDAELREKKKEFDHLHEFGHALASTLNLEQIFQIVVSRSRKLTGAEAAYLYLADEESGSLRCRRATGGGRKPAGRLRFEGGLGVAGWVRENRTFVQTENVSRDARFRLGAGMVRHYGRRAALSVPIESDSKVIGVLEVLGEKGGGGFTDAQAGTFLKLVDHAALAIERATLYQKTAEMAITDDLTQLFNLRYLSSVIEAEVDRAQRYGTGVSVVFIDLDHFKDVNDNYGHLVGSKVLVEVAQLLLRSLRSVDIVARYGGDEFVVVLPQTPLHEAVVISERIRRSIQKMVYLKDEELDIRLTASFGVTSYPEACRSRDDLLKLADEAMYMAKASNRNSVYTMRSECPVP